MSENILEEYSETFKCLYCGKEHTVTYQPLSVSKFLDSFNKNESVTNRFCQALVCECGKSMLCHSQIRMRKVWDFAGTLSKTFSEQ